MKNKKDKDYVDLIKLLQDHGYEVIYRSLIFGTTGTVPKFTIEGINTLHGKNSEKSYDYKIISSINDTLLEYAYKYYLMSLRDAHQILRAYRGPRAHRASSSLESPLGLIFNDTRGYLYRFSGQRIIQDFYWTSR